MAACLKFCRDSHSESHQEFRFPSPILARCMARSHRDFSHCEFASRQESRRDSWQDRAEILAAGIFASWRESWRDLRQDPAKIPVLILQGLTHEGHPGVVSMKQRLRSKVWWPGIDREAEKFCKTCHGCQLVSSPANPEPIKSNPLPSGPW